MRTNWRDCKAWKDANLPLSTTSNEACKLYDAAITQASGFYNEPSVGGLDHCIKSMIEADPNFIMGHIFEKCLNIGSTDKPLHLNPSLEKEMSNLNTLAEKSPINNREQRHLKAVNLFARGKKYDAVQVWKDILVDHPTDMFASRQAFITLINLGMSAENKDTTTRILSGYSKDTPGYSTILGWQAFNLEEVNMYDLAEKTAKQCLELDRYETYGAHALAHTYLEQGMHNKGIDFMLSTENDWNRSAYFACHNYWHVGLFYAEKGDFEAALTLFDQHVCPRIMESKSDFGLTDGAALLYRLRLEDVELGDRWTKLQETTDLYMFGHGSIFTEANLFFTTCHSEDKEKRTKQLGSLKQYGINDAVDWDNKTIAQKVGVPLCEGIAAYEDGNYSQVVQLIYPIRYQLASVGGSHAQRNVFEQILINAALRSERPEHNRLGRMLIAERRVGKESDPWSDRLMAQFVASHNL